MYYTNPYYVRTYCTNIYTAYFIFIIRAYVVNNICKRVIRHSSDLNFKRRGYNYPLLTIGKNLLIIMMTFFLHSQQHCPDNGVWIGSDMDGIVQFIIVNVNDKMWRYYHILKSYNPLEDTNSQEELHQVSSSSSWYF